MRWNTDVLTLERSRYGPGPLIFVASGEPTWHGYYNSACRDKICQDGWVLPKKLGTRIQLVFSTTIVSGASWTYYGRLSRAGCVGFQKLCGDTRETADLAWNTKIWWWPEIVTGPSE